MTFSEVLSQGPGIIVEQGSFITPYLLVYGTLRLNQNNWKRYLDGNAFYVGTYRLKQWTLRGKAAPFGFYTGNEDDSLVVDLFHISKDSLNLYSTNYIIDELEGTLVADGAYRQVLLSINVEEIGQTVIAKIYEGGYKFKEELYKQEDKYNGDFLRSGKQYLFIKRK